MNKEVKKFSGETLDLVWQLIQAGSTCRDIRTALFCNYESGRQAMIDARKKYQPKEKRHYCYPHEIEAEKPAVKRADSLYSNQNIYDKYENM